MSEFSENWGAGAGGERLVREHEVFGALFDLVPDVFVFWKDAEHRFVEVNLALCKLHNCRSPEEMKGRTDWDFHPPVLAGQYIAEDQMVMKSGRPLLDQIWLVPGASGMPRWYLCSKIPLFSKGRKVTGIAGVMRPYEYAGQAPESYARLTPAMDHVLRHYDEPVTIDDLARLSNLSASQFRRLFRGLFGRSPGEYLLEVRLQVARQQLERTTVPLSEVAVGCGFYDQSYFTKRFKKATGLRPLDYRRYFASKPATGRT